MKIGKFNVKALQRYIEDNKLSEVNSSMLLILAKLANAYLAALENEGILYKYKTAEGLPRTKKNSLVDSIIPTFSMISKILKDNSLVLPKNAMDDNEDEFNELLTNLKNPKLNE